MSLLKSLILLCAVSVGVAAFYAFGSMVGIWGESRSGVLAMDGRSSPKLRNESYGPPSISRRSNQAATTQRRGVPAIADASIRKPPRRGRRNGKLADQQSHKVDVDRRTD